MAKRKVVPAAETAVDMPEVKAPISQPIWEKYPNLLLYVVGAFVLVFAAWFGYKKMIVEPQQQEAVGAMWQAQQMFDRDSFQMALENPGGGYDGFLALADKYGSTKAGNLCHYYAGLCYLQTGNFDGAIEQLEKFNADGDLLPIMRNGVLGDCYSEKQDYGKALDYYDKAVGAGKNEVLTAYYLKKYAMLSEHEGKSDQALKAYERIKKDFPNPNSPDWRDIEKYIYRANAGK